MNFQPILKREKVAKVISDLVEKKMDNIVKVDIFDMSREKELEQIYLESENVEVQDVCKVV